MNKQRLLVAAILWLPAPAAFASGVPFRAAITGGGGGTGKCTIEVNVDASAEVEVVGDSGLLRTISGQPAVWRRFQCNEVMPNNPADFRFSGVDGRGSVRLLRDPRSNRGKALIRIDDPRGGREGYTFDLQWRRSSLGNGPGSGPGGPGGPGGGPGGGWGGGWQPGPPSYPPPPGNGGPIGGPIGNPGGFPMARAIQICRDSVTDRLNRDGYSYVAFERVVPDNNPGRNDWVIGSVSAKRGWGTTWFSFACSVDFRSGRVRSVDVRRR